MITILELLYCFCCVVSYGVFYGEFRWRADHEWKILGPTQHRESAGMALLLSWGGPLSLFMAWVQTGFAQHGLRWRL